jgi:GAF domain-containing protein
MRERLLDENESLRAQMASLRAENEQLKSLLARQREEEQWKAQNESQVEAELAHLVRLRVASQRLLESLDPRELLDILQDLLVNLVGSESLGIFELDPAGRELVLSTSIGIDAERFRRLPLGEGPIGHAARTGSPWLADLAEEGAVPAAEKGPRACVPLRLGTRLLGMVVLFGLLPHKPRLQSEDRELLELLATEGARALYCARGLASETSS